MGVDEKSHNAEINFLPIKSKLNCEIQMFTLVTLQTIKMVGSVECTSIRGDSVVFFQGQNKTSWVFHHKKKKRNTKKKSPPLRKRDD
jgi:hypothetical protein